MYLASYYFDFGGLICRCQYPRQNLFLQIIIVFKLESAATVTLAFTMRFLFFFFQIYTLSNKCFLDSCILLTVSVSANIIQSKCILIIKSVTGKGETAYSCLKISFRVMLCPKWVRLQELGPQPGCVQKVFQFRVVSTSRLSHNHIKMMKRASPQ